MKKHSRKILYIVVANLVLSAIILAGGKPDTATSLNISKYFSYATKDIIYPSDKQLEMLKAVMPKEGFQPAPPISERTYWTKIAATASGKNYLELALSELDEKPEVPIADSIYRRANLEGNRKIYKPRYYRTMERLEHFMLAECIENKGRFLPQISNYLNAIMDMKSWLHPNHDDSKNGVLEGRRVSIDLGARRFGSDLALAQVLLGEKLPKDVNDKITAQLKWRIVDTYLTSCKENNKNNKWIKSTSNWNSVCTSGSMFVSIATSKSEDERLAAVGSALNSMKHYLSGFGEDGYCSEGAGYWNYGFGHYLYLAQILYDYTEGGIDLFDAGNPEKLRNVGNFPQAYQIHPGICAPFSDGVSKVSNDGGFAYNMSARKFGAYMPKNPRKPKTHDSFSAVYQLIEWKYKASEGKTKNDPQPTSQLPGYTYFDDVGMVISRGKQNVPLSIAIKGGHNKENHNHSDVGTYTIVLNDQIMTGDIGAPSYIAGAFSDDNPARSSWGHPVPRINNTLQSNGREFEGIITATEFTDSLDKVVVDIKTAYEVPSLTKLIRTMENDKSALGAISIMDEFSLTEPVSFGTAIMTLSEYEIINANTVIFTAGNQKLKAEISSPNGALKIVDELVPVEHLREKGPAYRIGVDFTEPIKEGSITVKYTPVLE
ncbi:MAG: hypothetical protein ABJN84_04375 [Flavobacteriaceae bacterium]